MTAAAHGPGYDASGAAAYLRGRALPRETVVQWMALLTAEVSPGEVSAVLDLGCGTGRFSQPLADAFGADVLGTDPSVAMLAQARDACGSRVRLAAARGDAIPVRDRTFDAAFLSMVYHHLPAPAACTRELARVLREGGRVFVRNSTRETLDSVPYLRFFPEARDAVWEMLPGRADLVAAFAAGGLVLAGHLTHPQVLATDWRAYAEKLRQRALSDLRRIPDAAFERGMREVDAFARDAAGADPPQEQIELFTFRRA